MSRGKLRQLIPDKGPVTDLLQVNERLWQLVDDAVLQEERWQAERREWAEERASLRAMIDQVPDYLFVKDRQSRFTIANRAVAADLGKDPSGILGKDDTALHPPERASVFMADEQRVMLTGKPMIDKEELVVTPTGKQRWLLTSKLPLRNEEGVITGIVGIARDITLRRQAEEQIRFLAYYDPLTRLLNRSSCESRIAAMSEALPPGHDARLMLIDLDRFKHVNDTMGHGAGDDLLRDVADRLAAIAGSREDVARLGGDEFVIVRNFESGEQEARFYDSIVEALGAPFTILGNPVHVGASVGVSKIHNATTPLSALREADIALYEAKANGRGQWRLFEADMAAVLERKQQLEDDLRHALLDDERQIFVMYQPVFDVRGDAVEGLEALVRWRHPSLGLLSPDQFVSLAEERGMIDSLGRIVLRQACHTLAATHLPWIAINISPLQLRDPGFVDMVLETIEECGIEPDRILLEITEGILVEEFAQTNTMFDRLRSNGIRIALDDFGTGYSSLGYLAKLQVDKIKIDRSFVARIGSDSSNAIVCAIIAFAKALHIRVTAEGVETEEQRRFLEEAGCHEMQGFLLARPLDAPALQALLDSRSRLVT